MSEREKQFREFHVAYQERLYRLCRGFVDQETEAADLYQEVNLKIWVGLPKFRQESSLQTWAYRIAVNTAILYRKRSERRKDKLPLVGPPQERIASQDTSADERLQQLRQAIAQLPEADRMVITLLLENCSYAEIAEITGMSVNLIGVRINRAKRKLKTLMTTA